MCMYMYTTVYFLKLIKNETYHFKMDPGMGTIPWAVLGELMFRHKIKQIIYAQWPPSNHCMCTCMAVLGTCACCISHLSLSTQLLREFSDRFHKQMHYQWSESWNSKCCNIFTRRHYRITLLYNLTQIIMIKIIHDQKLINAMKILSDKRLMLPSL